MTPPGRGDRFVRAALLALDECGDPVRVRGDVAAALAKPDAARRDTARPPGRVKRVAWSAGRLAKHADDPARAYMALRELCAALFEPVAGAARAPAPAPEVALGLEPTALLDAIAPPPRVLARELALTAGLDTTALLADARPERRILGVRAVPAAKLGRFALVLAARIAGDPDTDVRTEALEICRRASGPIRMKLATALAPYAADDRAQVRVAAIDALRALALPPAGSVLEDRLADSSPPVRAAALRSVLPATAGAVGERVIAALSDPDAAVQAAALQALARCPSLHRSALVGPLVTFIGMHPGDTRAAIYLLGKLHAVAAEPQIVIDALHGCLAGPRSDAAHAAALVLQQLDAGAPEVPVETRLLRAARELAASDHETQIAGLFEASRLAAHDTATARSLVPAIRRLGDTLAATPGDAAARATLARVSEVLAALGVPPAELPRPRASLAPYRGIAPRERDVHGAYAIASVEAPATKSTPAISALGVWDHATGALLFVVEDAELLDFLPGRAEVGVVRCVDDLWSFDRYAVPAGERLGSLSIPPPLSRGWPSRLAAAADLVTIYCGSRDEPYRFHIKLGHPDRLLDE